MYIPTLICEEIQEFYCTTFCAISYLCPHFIVFQDQNILVGSIHLLFFFLLSAILFFSQAQKLLKFGHLLPYKYVSKTLCSSFCSAREVKLKATSNSLVQYKAKSNSVISIRILQNLSHVLLIKIIA